MHWACMYRPQNDSVESKEAATLPGKSNVPRMVAQFKKSGLFMRLEMIIPVLQVSMLASAAAWCSAVRFDW
jgi:hypothetical protein